MKGETNFDLFLKKHLHNAGFAERFRIDRETWNVAIQLASLRKKSGLSQKELAKRVGTSQQQISRLESPTYKGHSLSMLRRVADVLGANVYIKIQSKKQQSPPIVAEDKAIYRVKSKGIRRRREIEDFEIDFLRKEKVDIARNFRMVEALYKEAVTLGVIPLKNPLDGIDVDLRMAKVVNSV